jgi:hypothetical protein
MAIAGTVMALAAVAAPNAGAAPSTGTPASGVNTSGAPYWRGQDIVRGVALTHPASGSGAQPGGYVVDAWGAVHAFGGAPPMRASHYTPNRNTHNSMALAGNDQSGVVSTPGAKTYLFPLGTPLTESVKTCDNSSKLGVPTRGISYDPLPVNGRYNVNGATIDAWGGIHKFCGAADLNVSGAPYWKDWQIVYGLAVLPGGVGGFTVDGYGGVHAWGKAAIVNPPDTYWGPRAGIKAWNIARGIAVDGTGSTTQDGNGIVVDGWGGLHPFTYKVLP